MLVDYDDGCCTWTSTAKGTWRVLKGRTKPKALKKARRALTASKAGLAPGQGGDAESRVRIRDAKATQEARTTLRGLGASHTSNAQALRRDALRVLKVGAARHLQMCKEKGGMDRRAKKMSSEFLLEGTEVQNGIDWTQSAAAPQLQVVATKKAKLREPGTWRRLLPALRAAKTFLEEVWIHDRVTFKMP